VVVQSHTLTEIERKKRDGNFCGSLIAGKELQSLNAVAPKPVANLAFGFGRLGPSRLCVFELSRFCEF
jgi:hypothetical protein